MQPSYTIHQNQVVLKPAKLPIPEGEVVIRVQPAVDQPASGIPSGPVGEVSLVQKNGQPELLVSLGKPEKIILDTYRQAGGRLADWLVKHPMLLANLDAEKVGSAELAAFCEGVLLNAFRFERYKQKEKIDPCTLMIRASGGFDTVVPGGHARQSAGGGCQFGAGLGA